MSSATTIMDIAVLITFCALALGQILSMDSGDLLP